jgi:hypothetical protein
MLRPIFAILFLSSAIGCARDASHETSARAADTTSSQERSARVYLEIMLKIEPSNRPAAAGIYAKYKQPFLATIPGAISKQLLIRDEDVVVLHGFDTAQHAADYLKSSLFTNDVVVALKPLLAANPEVRTYAAP